MFNAFFSMIKDVSVDFSRNTLKRCPIRMLPNQPIFSWFPLIVGYPEMIARELIG
jgi:hypothetical protein